MADDDRIVFPDECEEVKAQALQKAQESTVTKDQVSEVEAAPEASMIQSRNMIQVPANCPPGYERGADGKCREVF